MKGQEDVWIKNVENRHGTTSSMRRLCNWKNFWWIANSVNVYLLLPWMIFFILLDLTNIHGTACDNVYHIRRNATKRIISIWLLFGLLGLQKLDILNIKVRFDVGDINFGFDIWMNYCGIKEQMLTFICVCSKRI